MNDQIKFNYFVIFAIYVFGGVGVSVLHFYELIQYPFWYDYFITTNSFYILLVQCIVFFLSLHILRGKFNAPRLRIFHIKKSIALFLLLIILSYIVFVFIFNFSYLLSPLNVRHSGDALVQRAIFFLGVFLILLNQNISIKLSGINFSFLISILLLFVVSIYPAATASRLVVVPFLMQLLISFYFRRLSFFVYFFLAFILLFASMASRGEPSFINFLQSLSHINFSNFIDILLNIVAFSFPGPFTLDVIINSNYIYPFQSYYLPLYLSPIQSSFLPEDILFNMSLSYPLGIDRNLFSLNFDLYTEGYYWLGHFGLYIWPSIIALVITSSERVLNSRFCQRPYIIHFLAHLSLFYLLFGGMVFSLRAGSRFLLLVIMLAILFKLSKLINIKIKSFKS